MKTRALLLSLLCLFLVGCEKNKPGVMADLSDFQHVSLDSEWVVINDPYTPIYSSPSETSAVSAHGRQGEIYLVEGKALKTKDKKTFVWYKISSGWLVESKIKVYSNKLQAEQAASSL